MCAIFGVLDFQGKLTHAQRLWLFRELADAAQIRGTDASGVAFVQNGTIKIQKAPRPACKMKWRIHAGARYLMGHTRMTTQGAAIKNYNNHPFPGKAGGQAFALAHNGVIYNDVDLRQTHALPSTWIQTDSYIAVQLLEKYGDLSMDSFKQMAEALDGSFTITVLDQGNTMYFVKGNNPLAIRLIPKLGCYLYASTDEILDTALTQLGLSKIPQSDIPISQGDIMTIDAVGQRTVSHFDDGKLRPQRYYSSWDWCSPMKSTGSDDYLEAVVAFGQRHGVSERELRLLLDAGYDAFDLEELIRDVSFRENCIQEIIADIGVY